MDSFLIAVWGLTKALSELGGEMVCKGGERTQLFSGTVSP